MKIYEKQNIRSYKQNINKISNIFYLKILWKKSIYKLNKGYNRVENKFIIWRRCYSVDNVMS